MRGKDAMSGSYEPICVGWRILACLASSMRLLTYFHNVPSCGQNGGGGPIHVAKKANKRVNKMRSFLHMTAHGNRTIQQTSDRRTHN